MAKQAITEEMDVHKEWMKEAKEQTLKNLPAFLKRLTEGYRHDYGTICHAMAAAAVAAAWAVEKSPQGGITGFQAGAVMWEIIKGWGVFGDGPKRMTCFKQMLYPQYEHEFRMITPETASWLKKEAKKLLADTGDIAHPEVIAHWKRVADGEIPFGYRVERH